MILEYEAEFAGEPPGIGRSIGLMLTRFEPNDCAEITLRGLKPGCFCRCQPFQNAFFELRVANITYGAEFQEEGFEALNLPCKRSAFGRLRFDVCAETRKLSQPSYSGCRITRATEMSSCSCTHPRDCAG